MLSLKIIGFILTISTTTIFGFLKANSLAFRYKKLCLIKNSITDLKQRIRLSQNELKKLIAISFKNITNIKGGLNKNDSEILDSFFENLGDGDIKTECERCELCISLLENQIIDAKNDNEQLNKLYKNVGFFSGVFICILFL